MSMNSIITQKRLQKQTASLLNEPIPGVSVKRDGLLSYHFCLYGLQQDYKGGIYHALLQLSPNYPFAPPEIRFFTPNGRFMTNVPICTSFTNFHKESWSSTWNIRSMITAFISFMYVDERGVGGIIEDKVSRKKYADNSLTYNLKSQKFSQLFKSQLEERGLLQKHSEDLNEEASLTQAKQKKPKKPKRVELPQTQRKQGLRTRKQRQKPTRNDEKEEQEEHLQPENIQRNVSPPNRKRQLIRYDNPEQQLDKLHKKVTKMCQSTTFKIEKQIEVKDRKNSKDKKMVH